MLMALMCAAAGAVTAEDGAHDVRRNETAGVPQSQHTGGDDAGVRDEHMTLIHSVQIRTDHYRLSGSVSINRDRFCNAAEALV